MKRLLAMGLGVSVLAAVGVVVFAGAACTGMSHRGDMEGHQHGDMAMMAAGQPAATPVFVNTKCPIMGGAINPAKVPESLTREYKGQKVACAARARSLRSRRDAANARAAVPPDPRR